MHDVTIKNLRNYYNLYNLNVLHNNTRHPHTHTHIHTPFTHSLCLLLFTTFICNYHGLTWTLKGTDWEHPYFSAWLMLDSLRCASYIPTWGSNSTSSLNMARILPNLLNFNLDFRIYSISILKAWLLNFSLEQGPSLAGNICYQFL